LGFPKDQAVAARPFIDPAFRLPFPLRIGNEYVKTLLIARGAATNP
jgi:hypothetical protein